MDRRGTRTVVLSICLIAGGGIGLAGQRSFQSPEARLGAAMHQADVEGDIDAAIAIFKEVAADPRASRATVAAALLGLAKAYDKRGDGEAQAIYERLDREFGDQPAAVEHAARRPPQPRQAAVRTWSGPGVDGSGSLSQDGRYLTFADWDTGDLAVRDLVSDTTRQLTNTGGWTASGDFTDASTLSPDGRSVAYHWWNTRGQQVELRVRTLAGRAPPRVVLSSADYVRPLAWTPDGRVVVYRQSRDRVSRLGLVSLRDGVYKDLVTLDWRSPRRASLSPDGRDLAYAVPAGANGSPRDVFLLHLSDGSQITAVSGAPDDYDPVWSPDGSQLLFLSTRTGSPSLWALEIRNGRPAAVPVPIKPDLGPVTLLGVTRDNALFYLVSGSERSDVYVAPMDGGRIAKPGAPVTDKFVSTNQGPAWSPDGESLAFYSLRRERPVLVIRSMATGVEHEVGLPSSLAHPFRSGPRWFPDSRSVLVLSRQDANFVFVRVYLDTGQTELLHTVTTLLSSFTLSPDGRTIFWAVQQGQLMKYDLVEKRATELATGDWYITVAISPDGRRLAYVKSTRSPQNVAIIEVMPATGGPAREIHRDTRSGPSRYNALAWSPDSTSLIFVDDANRLWWLPIEGAPHILPGTVGRGRIKSPAIHPSGARIAFGLSDNGNNEIWRLEHVLHAR